MQTGRSVGHVLAELVASGDDLLPVGRDQIPRVAEEHFAEVVEVVADGLEQGRRFGLGAAGDAEALLQTADRHRRRISRSEEHTSELQSRFDLVCRLLLEKKKYICYSMTT